jgi:hypothetical protein
MKRSMSGSAAAGAGDDALPAGFGALARVTVTA